MAATNTTGDAGEASGLRVVDVSVDRSGRMGPLSYLVPAHLDTGDPDVALAPGTAVGVPFGKRTAHGMVLGPGDPRVATREITDVWGQRVTPADVAAAFAVADRHLCGIEKIAPRLAPKDNKGADPVDAGPVRTVELAPHTIGRTPSKRRLVLVPPLGDSPTVAAAVAERQHRRSGGQVLILCPTVATVTATLAKFDSGAVRLDASAPAGAWAGFSAGTAAIGIGTRTAAMYAPANLAAIVVVDADHPGHLEAAQPRTHAADIAAIRTSTLDIPLTLIAHNATPRLLGAGVKTVTVTTERGWPAMELVERNRLDPAQRAAPRRVAAAIKGAGPAAKVLVLAAKRRSVWRCARCHELRPDPDGVNAAATRHTFDTPCDGCERPGAGYRSGWDADRITATYGDDVTVVTLAELGRRRGADLVVICDLDPALHAPTPDGVAHHSKVLLTAARAAAPDGRVLATVSSADDICAAIFSHRDLVAVAKHTWATARASQLPPFLRVVELSIKGRRPDPATFPGTVHGPQRVGSEWHLLVRCTDSELDALGSLLRSMRRRSKIRVTVT
jgi:primosomal protein N'